MGHQNVRGSLKIKNRYLFTSIDAVKSKHVLETVTLSIAHSHVLYLVKNVEKLVRGQRKEMSLSEWCFKDKMKFQCKNTIYVPIMLQILCVLNETTVL